MANELETLAADVEEYAERVAGGLGKKIDALAEVLEQDVTIVWPYIKAGITLLLSQVGQAAIAAEKAALPAIGASVVSGNITTALVTAGTVAAAAISSTVNAEAGADAQAEIAAANAAGVNAGSLEAPIVDTIEK